MNFIHFSFWNLLVSSILSFFHNPFQFFNFWILIFKQLLQIHICVFQFFNFFWCFIQIHKTYFFAHLASRPFFGFSHEKPLCEKITWTVIIYQVWFLLLFEIVQVLWALISTHQFLKFPGLLISIFSFEEPNWTFINGIHQRNNLEWFGKGIHICFLIILYHYLCLKFNFKAEIINYW